MKFGYFANMHGDGAGFDKPYMDCLDELREIARYCDQHRWDSYWLTEHHFSHEGFENLPNPLLMSADIAARTHHLRIGQAASIVTFWNPLRFAEDVAMLDHMSGGRIDVGVGRGIYGREAVNLNPEADTRDQERNRAIFDETLEVLKRAWTQPFSSFSGEHIRYPQPGIKWRHDLSPPSSNYMDLESGEIERLAVVPRPLQQPHPPLWQVVDSLRSIENAARQGMGAIMWIPPVDALKPRFEAYRRAASEARDEAVPLGQGIALVRDMFVAESRDEAREKAAAGIIKYIQWVCHWRGLGNHAHLNERVELDVRDLDFDWLDQRNLLFGTPKDVADKVEELETELNLEQLLVWSNFPGVPHMDAMNSIRLFTEKVMPRFRATAKCLSTQGAHT